MTMNIAEYVHAILCSIGFDYSGCSSRWNEAKGEYDGDVTFYAYEGNNPGGNPVAKAVVNDDGSCRISVMPLRDNDGWTEPPVAEDPDPNTTEVRFRNVYGESVYSAVEESVAHLMRCYAKEYGSHDGLNERLLWHKVAAAERMMDTRGDTYCVLFVAGVPVVRFHSGRSGLWSVLMSWSTNDWRIDDATNISMLEARMASAAKALYADNDESAAERETLQREREELAAMREEWEEREYLDYVDRKWNEDREAAAELAEKEALDRADSLYWSGYQSS